MFYVYAGTKYMYLIYLLFSFQGVLGEMVIRRVGDFPCMIGGALGGSLTLLASAFAPNMVTIVVLIGVGTGS